jgi:YfiH family protein
VLLRATAGAASVWCSGRHGGVSEGVYATCNVGDHVGDDVDAVAENRRRVADAAGLGDADHWIWIRQVHGVDVHVAEAPYAGGKRPVADAAVTQTRGLPLAVVTADCAPIVLATDTAVGVVHAGHRGLADGVVERAVEAVRAGAGSSARVHAFLGPCIRPDRYEFGAEDLAAFVERFGDDAVVATTAEGRPALDLPAGVRVALRRAGVDAADVTDSGICTAASDDYFSYRRDGVTGRQVTVAVLQ